MSSPQWRSIFINATKSCWINLNPFCLLYNSLLIKWFTSVEVEIWTKVLTKKCLYAKILKTGIFMFEYRFFYIARIFWEQTIDLGNSTKCYKVTCFPKLENWPVAEEILNRFHSIRMTILFDLSSVLINLYLVIAW